MRKAICAIRDLPWGDKKVAEKPIGGRMKQGRCRKHETI